MTPATVTERRTEQPTDKTAIRPFRFEAPEAELIELRRRINATRWPERETVADASQGVQLATTQALARYWATEYDWRRIEAKLNALPNFITEIDGLDIHFIHVRSRQKDALPQVDEVFFRHLGAEGADVGRGGVLRGGTCGAGCRHRGLLCGVRSC